MIIYKTLQQIIQMMDTNGKKAICIGAGHIFSETEKTIGSYIFCLADNAKYKDPNHGYKWKVISPQSIPDHYDENSHILLFTTRFFKEILFELERESCGNMPFYVPYDILDYNIDGSMDAEDWGKRRLSDVNRHMLMRLFEVYGISDNERSQKLKWLEERERSGALIIPKVCFLATTRCTKKCDGCIGMIEKMSDQKDYSYEKIVSCVDKFLESVDYVLTAEISGGEPFLYNEFDRLLDYMLSKNKILSMIIPTNSTVIPDEKRLSLLKNPKVSMFVSDYGDLVQTARLITLLEDNDIKFQYASNQRWIDPGNNLVSRGKSHEELCVDYQDCDNGRLCKCVYDGRIYHCARAARFYMMRDDLKCEDSLDFLSSQNAREDIRNFYLSEHCKACDYCDFTNPRHFLIPGTQINGKSKRSNYTFVKRS